MKKNRYIFLRLILITSIILKRKITLKKVINAVNCVLSYGLRRTRSGKYPFMINFELQNECNSNCVFCRGATGEIYDLNPHSDGIPIPKGKMPFEMYADIIRQVKDYLLMAILYINGEPLLYKDIFMAIKLASDNCVPTMIATNGILLNKENIEKLLRSGLDFIKIAVSGFTQDVYSIQHRFGNIEQIKANLEMLARMNREGKYGCVIMLDYIYYEHNDHETGMFREFCNRLGIIFNVRRGNCKGMEYIESKPRDEKVLPVKLAACSWLWSVLSINWNGDLLPCCDYVIWSGLRPYATYRTNQTTIAEIWNGHEAIKLRELHKIHGREIMPICAQCRREGAAFKY